MNAALLTILIPCLGALGVCFSPKKYKAFLASAALLSAFTASIFAIPFVYAHKELYCAYAVTPWFTLSFVVDGLAVFMACVSSCVAFVISLYAFEYMKHYDDAGVFYFWMTLFVGAMMGLIFSGNLMLMFCFWEVTSVCSWRLIAFYRKETDVEAAARAFLITFFAASLMLVGIIFIYFTYGTLEIVALRGTSLNLMVSLLLLAGIISKSAQLPLHTWLPDAGVAPTPVTALLHAAVLVKIGVYVFARLFGLTFIATAAFLNIVLYVSIATIIVGGALAFIERNMKRILAYSTISQLGYILLIFSLNTRMAFLFGLVYIVAHSIGKAGLFLCAGIVEHKTGVKDVNELGGLAKTMPYTAAAYLLCAFSIIGLPPFLGFWPKFMAVVSSLQQAHTVIAFFMVFGALLTLLYLMRLFEKVFLGTKKTSADEQDSPVMVSVVGALGVASLVLGFAIRPLFNFLSALVQ